MKPMNPIKMVCLAIIFGLFVSMLHLSHDLDAHVFQDQDEIFCTIYCSDIMMSVFTDKKSLLSWKPVGFIHISEWGIEHNVRVEFHFTRAPPIIIS